MSNTLSLAYVSPRFLALGQAIASWCTHPEIQNTLPSEVSYNGRHYLVSLFGHCPSQAGVAVYFAYDEMNDEFCVWDSEDLRWCHDLSPADNLEAIEPSRFSSLDKLALFICFGHPG